MPSAQVLPHTPPGGGPSFYSLVTPTHVGGCSRFPLLRLSLCRAGRGMFGIPTHCGYSGHGEFRVCVMRWCVPCVCVKSRCVCVIACACALMRLCVRYCACVGRNALMHLMRVRAWQTCVFLDFLAFLVVLVSVRGHGLHGQLWPIGN